jgi:ATPase subunit of ABC transporter with duplicated ATPase domains
VNGPSTGTPVAVGDGLAAELADGRVLFENVDIAVGPGTTGLVGRNGVGKTTLVRILVGDATPTRGQVVRNGAIAWLPQHRIHSPAETREEAGAAAAVDHGSVADALGVSARLDALRRIEAGSSDPADFAVVGDAWDLPARIEAQLDRAGLGHLDAGRPFASLSGGERTRVALARLALTGADAFLLDEPTNDLDAAGRRALADWVADRSEAILVITHDRDLLRRVDRIVELTPRGARGYGGGWDLFAEQREDRRRGALARVRHAQAAARREKRDAQARLERQERRTSQGARSAKKTDMSALERSARKERAEQTTGRVSGVNETRLESTRAELRDAASRLDEVARIEVSLASSGLRSSRTVLEARGLAFTPPGTATPLFSSVSLRIVGPERIALTGPNGAGKTTLMRILAGALEPTQGSVARRLDPAETAWLDQRATLLGQDRTVLEAFRATNPGLDPTRSRHALARYLFEGDAALAPVDRLSGGERIRAALACTVGAHHPPKLLFLDEPTNHLDLEGIEAVEGILRRFDGALVVVSHDADFLEAIGVERTVELRAPPGSVAETP